MSLRFQRAIVVGASSGIGAEIARQLAAEGAAVAHRRAGARPNSSGGRVPPRGRREAA